MRPTLALAPITLAIAPTLAKVAGIDTLTVQGDHSPTVKGWRANVRPTTRRNAWAAIVRAIHASSTPEAAILARALRASNDEALAMVAAALPIWAECSDVLGSLREGWNREGDTGWRGEFKRVGASVFASLDAECLAQCEAEALANLESMEAERIEKGKAAPFPTVKVGAATMEAAPTPTKGKRKGKGKA